MKKPLTNKKIIFSVYRYICFFLVIAFLISCCMLLFISTLASSMDLTFTAENIGMAAKLTFANVILLTTLFALVDALRRKLQIERPVRKIVSAAEQLMKGDFSVRITPSKGIFHDNFDEIITYFNKMAEELSGTETLRTDFIANVSHELKTPLSIIKNYGTMLQQRDLPEDKRLEYSKAITDTSARLAELITNILKLNKLENQQIFSTNSVFDLSEQLCECLLGFEDIWERKNLEIETDLEDSVLVESDRELLSLVWNNLFSNAIKFTDEGGKIYLSLSTTPQHAIVKIADTGCGISKDVGARIFDKFYQGDTSHSTQGNGLGLALVKRVIDITESDIAVESEPGKGTTFTVKIRRHNNEQV